MITIVIIIGYLTKSGESIYLIETSVPNKNLKRKYQEKVIPYISPPTEEM
jgi:hypothetical protein